MNGAAYTVISSASALANGTFDPTQNYVLGGNISGVTGATPGSGAIGGTAAFTGQFNGFGHSITSPTLTATGLFDTIGAGAVVSNLGITNATISGSASAVTSVGTLANLNLGSIVNSFASISSLTNTNITNVGGLVGTNAGLIAQRALSLAARFRSATSAAASSA